MPELAEVLAQWMVLSHFILDSQANGFKLYIQGLLTDATKKEAAASPPQSRWREGKVDFVPKDSRRFIRGGEKIAPKHSIVPNLKKLWLRNVWIVSRRIIVLDFGSAWLALHLRTHCLIQIMNYEQFMNGVWDVPKDLRFKIPLALQLGDPKLENHTATAPSFFLVCTSQDMMLSIQWLKIPTQQKLISPIAFAPNTPTTILGDEPDVASNILEYVKRFVDSVFPKRGTALPLKKREKSLLKLFKMDTPEPAKTMEGNPEQALAMSLFRALGPSYLEMLGAAANSKKTKVQSRVLVFRKGSKRSRQTSDNSESDHDPQSSSRKSKQPHDYSFESILDVSDGDMEVAEEDINYNAEAANDQSSLLCTAIHSNELLWPGVGSYTVCELLFESGVSPFRTFNDVLKDPSAIARLILAYLNQVLTAENKLLETFGRCPLEGYVVAASQPQRMTYASQLHVYGKDYVSVPHRMKKLQSDVTEGTVDADIFEPDFIEDALTKCLEPDSPYTFLAVLAFGLEEWQRLSGNSNAGYGNDPLTEYFRANNFLPHKPRLPQYESLFSPSRAPKQQIETNLFSVKKKVWTIYSDIPKTLGDKQKSQIEHLPDAQRLKETFRNTVENTNLVKVGPTDFKGTAIRLKKHGTKKSKAAYLVMMCDADPSVHAPTREARLKAIGKDSHSVQSSQKYTTSYTWKTTKLVQRKKNSTFVSAVSQELKTLQSLNSGTLSVNPSSDEDTESQYGITTRSVGKRKRRTDDDEDDDDEDEDDEDEDDEDEDSNDEEGDNEAGDETGEMNDGRDDDEDDGDDEESEDEHNH